MIDIDTTCGDPAMGEACENGRWFGFCNEPDCEGMCAYQGVCLCKGCESPECCVWSCMRIGEFLVDQRSGANLRRTIVEGPPVP